MEFCTDYTLEKFILNTRWEELTGEVRERAVVCGIDLTAALLLGARGRQFQTGLFMARNFYKEGTVPVVGSRETFCVLGSAVAMSHASNSFDIDDGHNMIKGHPGASFVGGVLAAALEKGISYREYLTALTVCYEAAIRCGLAIQDHYQFHHSTGSYGAFGTAAGMGRILGFSAEQLNHALSIAEFHAPLSPVMRSVEYPSMNKDGVPFGTLVGAEAALEALSGSTGRGYLLEMPEYRAHLDSLGTVWEIMNLYFKPYTCCRWAHQPIAACIDLAKMHVFQDSDVEKIYVHTFKAAAQLSKAVPRTTDEAQYNVAWPVACALVHRDVGLEQVIEESLDDLRVLDMMKRLEFEVDPALEAQFPARRLAWVEIWLKDGRRLKSDVYAAAGEHTDRVDLSWIEEKFRLRTAPILAPERQEEILRMLETGLDCSVRDVVSLLNNM